MPFPVLVFPYIFLLFDCFKWVLIDRIIKCRLHSMLWQFWWGVHLPLVSTCFLYALVFPYIFLLFCLWYLHVCSMHCYFLISSYYLTVSNGHSLTTLKSVEVTQCCGSFKWGVHQFYPGKSENLSSPAVISLYLPIIWLFQMGAH